jgi:riboflavin synthase
VASIARGGGVISFQVAAPRLAADLAPGASVAVNGVCQTVTETGPGAFKFDSVAETLKCTNLGLLSRGSSVNLEAALRLGDRISGHLVSGHIDSTGVVRARRAVAARNCDFTIQVADDLRPYICGKGSICLDGVSLTVKGVKGSMVEVTVIPFTLDSTIIGAWRVGGIVNVEVDQIAKYLAAGRGK